MRSGRLWRVASDSPRGVAVLIKCMSVVSDFAHLMAVLGEWLSMARGCPW